MQWKDIAQILNFSEQHLQGFFFLSLEICVRMIFTLLTELGYSIINFYQMKGDSEVCLRPTATNKQRPQMLGQMQKWLGAWEAVLGSPLVSVHITFAIFSGTLSDPTRNSGSLL